MENDKPKVIKTELDLDIFNKPLECSYIDLPYSEIGSFQKKFRSLLLTRPKLKPL